MNWCIPQSLPYLVLLAIMAITKYATADDAPSSTAEPSRYGTPNQIATLEDQQIFESSGMAPSYLHEDVYWTHNDSGDAPRLYAFDREGTNCASLDVAGAEAVDWEDMCSFMRDGRAWLLVADVGDNLAQREELALFLIGEPLDLETPDLTVEKKVRFQFEGGPQNCEAIAFEPDRGRVWLITKSRSRNAGIYCLDWPALPIDDLLIAREIGTLPISYVTAMDFSSDGRRAIVLGLRYAYEYSRDVESTWPLAFDQEPRRIAMPIRQQGEAICYSAEGEALLLTSEKLPTPLWEIRQEEDHNDSQD